MRAEMATRRVWKNWALPLLVIAAMVAVVGTPLSYYFEIPLWGGLALGVAFWAGVAIYIFGEFRIYDLACRRLGYRCELRPNTLPRSARYDADIVISGNFHGRPFTLYREIERNRGSSTRNTFWSVVEWVSNDIRLPAFTLQVMPSGKSGLQKAVLSGLENAMTVVLRAAGRELHSATSIGFAFDSRLSGRSVLSAADADGVRAVFTHTVCDTLDSLIDSGHLQAAPGLLVFHEMSTSQAPWNRDGKFPLPWEIERYLDRVDNIRRAFVV
jgi:hypothetical protein